MKEIRVQLPDEQADSLMLLLAVREANDTGEESPAIARLLTADQEFVVRSLKAAALLLEFVEGEIKDIDGEA